MITVMILVIIMTICINISHGQPINIAITVCGPNALHNLRFFLGSLLENPSKDKVTLFVIIDEYAENVLSNCLPSFRERLNITLIQRADFSDSIPQLASQRYLCAFDKLMMDKILPQSIDKVLYLDVDIIMLEDLQNLWKHWGDTVVSHDDSSTSNNDNDNNNNNNIIRI